MQIDDDVGQEFADLCDKYGFWRAATERSTLIVAIKVALIVGTILLAINQGDIVLSGDVPPIWKIILTYCVPFSVSSFSTATFKVALAQRAFCKKCGAPLHAASDAVSKSE